MPFENYKPSIAFVNLAASNVAPQSFAAAANVTGGWTKVTNNKWAKILSAIGAGTGTLALKVEQATDGSGTGVKDLMTAAALGITAQATGTIVQVDFSIPDNIDLVNGFGYIRLNATMTGGSGTLVAASLELGPASFEG